MVLRRRQLDCPSIRIEICRILCWIFCAFVYELNRSCVLFAFPALVQWNWRIFMSKEEGLSRLTTNNVPSKLRGRAPVVGGRAQNGEWVQFLTKLDRGKTFATHPRRYGAHTLLSYSRWVAVHCRENSSVRSSNRSISTPLWSVNVCLESSRQHLSRLRIVLIKEVRNYFEIY